MGTVPSWPLPMRARQVVLLASPKSSHPRPLLFRQHFIPLSPLAATLMDLPASVADNRLTARLSPLAATLTKNRGVGVLLLTKNLAQNLSPARSRASRGADSAKGATQHTSTRNFRTLMSSSPTILRDADSWSKCEYSAEELVTSSDTFDLIVIGCGPAGEKGGAQAAYFGKRVAVIERAEHMGGSCINTGTVPSKTLRESALYFSGLKQRGL